MVSTSIYGKPFVYWVIDTGDIHHITPTLKNFISYYYGSLIDMKLPNGTTILTNITESVFLSNILTLRDVYYILIFSVNLISTSKVFDSSFCHLNFINTQCFILQKDSKTLICLADRHVDLYVLTAQTIFSKPPSLLVVIMCLMFPLLLDIGD